MNQIILQLLWLLIIKGKELKPTLANQEFVVVLLYHPKLYAGSTLDILLHKCDEQ